MSARSSALDLGGAEGGGVGRHALGAGEEVVPRHVALVGAATEHDDLLEVGEGGEVTEGLDVVGVEEVGDGEQQPGPGAVQDVCRLVALEAGVERHENRADAVDGRAGDDPLGAVRRPDGYSVTGLDAGGDQGPAGLVDGGQQLRERQAEVALDQGLHVGEEPGGALQRAGNGRGQVSGDGDLVGHGGQDCIPGRGPSPATAPPAHRPGETSAYMIHLPCRGPSQAARRSTADPLGSIRGERTCGSRCVGQQRWEHDGARRAPEPPRAPTPPASTSTSTARRSRRPTSTTPPAGSPTR